MSTYRVYTQKSRWCVFYPKIRKKCVNIVLRLMLAKCTATQCFNPCRRDFIRVGMPTQRRIDSRFDETRPVALRMWSQRIFNEQGQNVKWKVSIQQADRRKFTPSGLMYFVFIATLCLRPWVAFTTLVPAKRYSHLSLKQTANVALTRENPMN